jgi:hypothetical protein
MQMFRKQSDAEAFERVMVEAHQRQPIRGTETGTGTNGTVIAAERRDKSI